MKKACIALLTHLLRGKFGLQPELDTSLQQLPGMEIEKLEDLAVALVDFRDFSGLQTWLATR